MGLTTLLGIKLTLGGMSLPQYMNAVQRGELKPPVEHDGLAGFMPTPPAQPAPPKPDPVEAALAKDREEQKLVEASDREAMLARIRARRVHTYANPQTGELERQHRINKRMDAAEAALNGGNDE